MKSLFLFLLLCLPAQAQMAYPTVYQGEVPIDSDDADLKGLKWHKWSTQNFTILSISDAQGDFLAKNIEEIKGWCLSRWGIPVNEANNFKFSAEARVFCVPTKALMQKLLKLDRSRVEIKRRGKIEISIAWLLLDDIPLKTVPIPITEICLAEMAQKYNNKLSFCLLRGMCLLNGTAGQVRVELATLAKTKKFYLSEDMFKMTLEQWNKLPQEDRGTYDGECVVLCLLLRKEFGETKFHQFLSLESKNQTPETILKSVYEFRDYKQFDASFTRYTRDLCSDIVSGKTPDSYLEIKAKESK